MQAGLLQVLGWSHRDVVGCAVAVFAAVAILANVLFLQPGPHPAPMVQTRIAIEPVAPPVSVAAPAPAAIPAAADPAMTLAGATASLPRPRPVEAIPKSSAQPVQPILAKAEMANAERPKAEPPGRANHRVIADIQRELSRRGFYDGMVDGRYGPRTDAAIREFERTAKHKPSAEPSEALLRAIVRSRVKAQPASQASVVRPPAPLTRPDPIGEMLTPSKRVVAVQRALTEFGYGQISPSGIVDGETQAAIEKFERERRLPVTGQISHRVVRELATMTGRPLE